MRVLVAGVVERARQLARMVTAREGDAVRATAPRWNDASSAEDSPPAVWGLDHPSYRLSYNLPRGHVVARDSAEGRILIGGLGSLGVGQMWKTETADDRTREGYGEAPEVISPPDLTLHRWGGDL